MTDPKPITPEWIEQTRTRPIRCGRCWMNWNASGICLPASSTCGATTRTWGLDTAADLCRVDGRLP